MKRNLLLVYITGMIIIAGLAIFTSCTGADYEMENEYKTGEAEKKGGGFGANEETAVLGGGCFWCLEAIFEQLKGVSAVESGYAGGFTENPTYTEVCSGKTGHAEVIKIIFNPQIISYRQILEVFFYIHDPTTPDRQGNDVGDQYRSIILFGSPEQKKTAQEVISELDGQKLYENPVVTEVKPLKVFYRAEDYHQSYFSDNASQPYCQLVIIPKVGKFQDRFADLIK